MFAFYLRFGDSLSGFLGKYCWEKLEKGQTLKVEFGEGLLVLVHVEFPGEKVSVQELLEAEGLKSDPDEADVVLLKLGLD